MTKDYLKDKASKGSYKKNKQVLDKVLDEYSENYYKIKRSHSYVLKKVIFSQKNVI